MAKTGTTKFLGNGRAKQAQLTHFFHHCRIKGFFAEILNNPRQQHVISKGAGGFAHHALFIGQLCIQKERIVPLKLWF